MKDSDRAAWLARSRWKVIEGGRHGVPRALDTAQLESRPRPVLRLIRGGRWEEPGAHRAPAVALEVPRRRSHA